jgi:RNA polymerase sigma-70 factor (ECF subfamily)
VFDYDYEEIAAIVDKEQAACRQLLSRAKKHIADHRPRFKPTPDAHRQILNQFIQAVGSGELAGLLQLLANDVVLWADGCGKTRGAATRPLRGRDTVARFLLASTRLPMEGAWNDVAEVNGDPSLIIHWDGQVRVVVTIGVDQGRVYEIRVVGNPDKLQWLNRALHYSGERTE